eukprot:gnl/MRDRNA2_/MRDRNA2_77927_c0_seq1.p1 gnl/MRDRNA2_/MRDRNA2_77927_c0~~gnl/MRDRNA2_/MRDRNA2_77927_c0_seq1.p1  ORF type:complete len:230 (+),score=36.33 gnl/MRDRNA2_/MRDRNA2_77927_c0_seq1:71-691(+)
MSVNEAGDVGGSFVEGLLLPVAGQLTFGSTLGFCAGMALRVVGKVACVGVGSAFCLIQGLAYKGYIQVNWRQVERDYVEVLDRDRDGQVTMHDFELLMHDLTGVLTFNLPAGTGFAAGLAYGFGSKATTSLKGAALAGVGARILLPRALLGGAGTMGGTGAFVGLDHFLGWGTSNNGLRSPNLLSRHLLGEEKCVWAERKTQIEAE